MSNLNNIIYLSKDNEQLLDAFSNDYYLEIGNIKPEVLQKFLKNKSVNYKDLVYFDIQNNGIGTSNISNQNLKTNIPYFYFLNLERKYPSSQLFLTYGILVQREGYKEYFTPIFLLPITYYFDKGSIFIRLIGNIIENPYLQTIKKLSDSKAVKLNDIYALDDFMMSSFKKEALRLESYITCAKTIIPNAIFSSEKFTLDGPNLSYVHSKFNLRKQQDICNVTSLNKEQREALEEANFGNSFALTGALGTGKTTTLENIASNAIYHNKRVLYLSCFEETLTQVYEFFKSKGLEYLTINLNYPIECPSKKNRSGSGPIIDKVTRNELDVKYDGIDSYSKLLYKKINNTNFLDVINGYIKYRNENNDLQKQTLKGIDSLYRLEVTKVKDALTVIDENLSRINSFRDSKFNNIPIKTNENKKTIQKLLKSAYDAYGLLLEKKESFEKDYGFESILNYAFFRNLINNFNQVNLELIPDSWKTCTQRDLNKKKITSFEKAKELFPVFQEEMKKESDMEKALKANYDYDKLFEFNVKEAIDLIKSNFKDEYDINAFLQDNENICDHLNKIIPIIDECEFNFGKMRDKLGVKINNRDTDTIKQLSAFMKFYNSYNIPKIWLDIRRQGEIRTKISQLQDYLYEYTSLLQLYNKYFTNLDEIDLNIAQMKKKGKKKGLFKDSDVSDLSSDFARLKEMLPSKDSMISAYKTYTGKAFKQEDDALAKYDEFIKLLKGIENELVQTKLIKNISSLTDASLKEFLKPFVQFISNYENIIRMYNELCLFKLAPKNDDLSAMILKIKKVKDYCDKILTIQRNIDKVTKSERSYVNFDKYLTIAKDIEEISKLREEINNNSDYKKLYGKMFTDYNSNVSLINKQINHFSLYMNIFKTNEYIIGSLDEKHHAKIASDLKDAFEVCEKISEIITEYAKIFRDSVSKFYYDDIQKVTIFLDDLIKSGTELDVYLKICDNMKVLLQHKLDNFVKYIIEHDNERFEKRFMIAYYSFLYQKFKDENPEIVNSQGYYKLLSDIIEWEGEICNTNAEKIKYYRPKGSPRLNLKGLDFDALIDKAKESKYLYLANLKTFNYFLNVNNFDLILVDDAQFGEYDQYVKALSATQVVFAGVNDVHFGIYNDVFSRIRRSATIDLKYRFTPSPRDLMSAFNNASPTFYNDEALNMGLILSNKSSYDCIFDILTNEDVKNNKIKINYYAKDIEKIRLAYDVLTNKMLDAGMEEEDIYKVFENNINICDLYSNYLVEADYNVFDLKDYYLESDSYTISNMINKLVCVKSKLYIVDEEGLFKDKTKHIFIDKFNQYLSKNIIVPLTDDVSLSLAKALTKYKIKVLGKYKFYDILLQHGNKNYGIIIYNTSSNYDNDIIETNRYKEANDIKPIVLFINDVATSFDNVLSQILEEMK